MKKIILYNILVILMYSNIAVYAQHGGCGTELLPAQIEYMNATREARKAFRAARLKNASSTINIPLVAHIIRQDDGTGGLSDADLATSIEQLNDQFDDPDLDIYFEHCITSYVNKDDYYEGVNFSLDRFSEEYGMAKGTRVEGAINAFFLPNPSAFISLFTVGGWSSFPAYKDAHDDKDWIVMNNASATNGTTLAHEVGHYLNLYHTHQGPTDSGTPFSSDHDYELPDGGYTATSDMSNLGDELYDTPADPTLYNGTSYVNEDDCIYDPTVSGSAPDLPTGYTMSDYMPDVTNIMSYADRECTNSFSPQQKVRMLESVNFDRNYLEASCSDIEIPDCKIFYFDIVGVIPLTTCNDNDTPNNSDDDWKLMKAQISYLWSAGDVLIIETPIETISVSVPEGRGHIDYILRMPANGQTNTTTVYFADDPSCSKTYTNIAIDPCSIPQPCESDVNISTTYAATDDLVVESSNYITAQNTVVPDGADVVYNAGIRIRLLPDFMAANGSRFIAKINDCQVVKLEEPENDLLLRNFPSPFTGQTTIAFSLPQDSPVTLTVSDVTGRHVATLLTNEITQSGTHEVTFDGTRHTAGVYYYTIQAGDYVGTQKMISVK